ncbi:AarF/ABC1/UbiB kinase family protein [Candidatus Woesearchaeota archaeon]|nr:AarF/ABC1/UbiB kinase family protein [Candidatus Woesearchaeota archaeon]
MHSHLSIKRLKDVASALFEFEFHHISARLNLSKYLPFHKRLEPDTKVNADPETLRKLFERLGGAFIKLGQLLALRPDLIGRDYGKEFEKLLTDVPPEDDVVITGIVKDIPFSKFNAKPLGSASIAQVHKATLNGKIVAVKIKRPGVEKKFDEDIAIMEFLAHKIKEKYNPSFVDPVEVVEEFKKYTEKEMDFNHEAANIRRFASNFKGSRDIVIPKVYEQYSTRDILVMKFEEGKNILHGKKTPGLIKKVTNAVYKMLFEDRFFHADLHPGNIYVQGSKVVLLDFGIVGHIDKILERKLFHLFSSLVNGNLEGVADALQEINIGKEEPDVAYLREGLYNVLADYYDQPLQKMHFGKIFYGAIDVARRSRIKVPAQLVLFGKSIVTMEGFCRQVDPNFNVIRNAKPFVKKVIKKELSPRKLLNQAKDFTWQLHELVASTPETVRNVIRRFNMMEERIVDIDNTFQRLINVMWKGVRLMTSAIVLLAFIIASLMLIDYEPMYYGFSLYSLVGFGISLGLLIYVIMLIREA